jgi:bile acid:Na+ symporter, BASS family
VVFVSILIPIAAGIFLHTRAPAFAERIARPLTSLSGLGVVACIIVVWIAAAPAMWLLIGNGTVIALAAFVLVGLAIGHILGGPEPQNRTALAIATASRHPGIALILAKANFPAETLVGPARCH